MVPSVLPLIVSASPVRAPEDIQASTLVTVPVVSTTEIDGSSRTGVPV
jgi:hypothetical protein